MKYEFTIQITFWHKQLYLPFLYSELAPIGSKVILMWSPADLYEQRESRVGVDLLFLGVTTFGIYSMATIFLTFFGSGVNTLRGLLLLKVCGS